jgi:curved DNA-binding protein
MSQDQPFIDYYNILQADPHCNAQSLEASYRYLAKKYHPDHRETANAAKFNEVVEAYRCLRDPDQRAEYDILHAAYSLPKGQPLHRGIELDIDTKAALDDADAQARILLHLYKRRRQDAQNAGVVPFYLQSALGCSDEHFEFHRWYLKAKGFVETNEQGTMSITIEGVDHVISTSRTAVSEKLLTSRFADPDNRDP